MDWIENKLKQLKKKVFNLSLKSTLILYIVLTTFTVTVITIISNRYCERWKLLITERYLTLEAEDSYTNSLFYETINIYKDDMSKEDQTLAIFLRVFSEWGVLFYSAAGIVTSSWLFYHNKLKTPIEMLTIQTGRIQDNDLSYMLQYESEDEMGELCRSFNQMRQQLESNQQKIWDIAAEQKELNSAFAHDIRNPLTVLNGYIDLLCRYYPAGKIPEEKLIDTLKKIRSQIKRLDHFTDTMKQVNSLSEITVVKSRITADEFVQKLSETISGFQESDVLCITLENNLSSQDVLHLDLDIITEILENVLSNALRYAESSIVVTIEKSDYDLLELYVQDDGTGFLEADLRNAKKAYYKSSSGDSSHLGMGLYICKVLAGKHGGYLTLSNSIKKGAIISISLQM